ncbi:hypothetical protein I3842_13G057200 [Carya illinoinensis]|uniref:Uncharacterized protein n=1 Tax=Carya illinoinensis TaxID=32201 RepID=A0A922AM45_CARIL|nr:hypothetical protein I3842_13G057200 [Carya illinoinensis]
MFQFSRYKQTLFISLKPKNLNCQGQKEEEAKIPLKVDTIEIHLRALADLVNVNSLFTVAVFVGLSFANSEVQSLEVRPECNADFKMSERLVVLVATTLKVHLNIYGKEDFKKPVLKTYSRLLLAAWGSILGCVFLVLSMIDVIQIRIGKLSCGSRSTVRSVASLVSIVGLAFIIYVPALMHAIFVSLT